MASHLSVTCQDDVAIITMDMAGKSANILSRDMITELSEMVRFCEAQTGLRGMIIRSAKPSGFVFGADITEFEALQSADDVRALQSHAMGLLDQLETSQLVSVALLHGPVLGGGLELALGCDYRLIQQDARIMMGFPEANLGLMPGFAGTARGARLAGLETTLRLCLSAKPLTTTSDVIEQGLADGQYDEAHYLSDARALIQKSKRAYGAFCDSAHWHNIIADAKDRYLADSRESHAPHLYEMIRHFELCGPDYRALASHELQSFPALMLGEVSANLRRVFALTDKVKKQARGRTTISHVEVIGAGVMGADIAALLCLKGMRVSLSDVSDDALIRARGQIESYLVRKLGDAKADIALGRLSCETTPSEPLAIDLVIEAVPEQMALKQKIWAAIEPQRRPDCVFATNSSALDLEQIGQAMRQPHRLAGLHFFNPATVMPLIEVVHHPKSEQPVIDTLMQFSTQLGKLPVAIQNSPGFLVNRALLPYIFEALAMMLSGTEADEIDQALVAFGMPMGPIELADQIGLDVCLDVGARLGMADNVKTFLEHKGKAGELGRKTGQGIYHWQGKKADRRRDTYDKTRATDLTEALLAPMIAQCQASLAEGHVASADFVDAAMIYGVGFPRYTGGPLHYAARSR